MTKANTAAAKVQNLLVMTLLSIALAISIHAVNAKEIILKCRTLNSNGSQQLTIDLDNGWLAFASGEQAAHGEANSSFKILKVSDVAITAILENPIPTHGEEIFVLNRETGQYITTHVGLSCADNKCSSQKGPTIETFRGNCRPPIF